MPVLVCAAYAATEQPRAGLARAHSKAASRGRREYANEAPTGLGVRRDSAALGWALTWEISQFATFRRWDVGAGGGPWGSGGVNPLGLLITNALAFI